MAKCGACGRFIAATDAARCHKCNASYERACVGLPTAGAIPSSWRCPECKKNVVRDNKADTPVRGRAQDITTSAVAGSPDKCILESNTIQEVPRDFINNLKLFSEELRSVRIELQLFREEMAELRSSLKVCTERMDGLEARVEALEQRKMSPSAESSGVNEVIAELRRELNDREQELLYNDVEISNLPESTGENPVHLVGLIASKLGITMDERDIVSAERVGGHHIIATSPTAGETERRRPRPLIVRLTRRHLRDELLRCARVRRGATTADLGMTSPPRRFYVNERLTKQNRQLFRKAREAGNRLGWRFVWTKRGTILARNKPADPYCIIRCEADIPRFFGVDTEACTQE